jgi:ABC-type transport system involved in cytochrome bd biosynthesis fused ATPase/permease subunit
MIKGGNSLDIYFARFIPQFFSALITPISIIAILFILDPLSAVIAIVTIPLIPVFGALIGRFTQDAVEAKWRSLGTLGKYFEDSLRGIHTLSIFSRLKGQAKRIEEMGDRYTDETMKVLRISFLSALVLELAATISVALIAVSVGLRLVNGSIEFWPSLSILILAPDVYFPLRNAASLFHASADGGAALNEIDQLLAMHSDVKDEGGLELTHVEEISWSNWSSPFGAGSLPARTLKPGDSLVIRGGSGLGKTTFINAILGYGDSRGISINGQEISGYRKRFVSPCIGWIPQNPALISGTLRELFQYLKADIADDEIEFTLSKVGLHHKDLPDGLETTIGGLGEKSGTLSGGQIRRIAIARAIVQSPSIVIADEPTADLDPKSAQEILRLLEDIASSGAIVIAVLHAPDHTLSGADEIAMVER